MSQRKSLHLRDPKIELKAIKYRADYQLAWNQLIPRLREYSIQTVDFLSIAGDAPKDFITIENIGVDIAQDDSDPKVTSLKLVRSSIRMNQSRNN